MVIANLALLHLDF